MYFFGSNLSPPGAAMLTHTLITNEEQKTVSVCIIKSVPQMPALSMMLQTQTARHKLAVFMVTLKKTSKR